MISLVILAQLFGADARLDMPSGVYVMGRDNGACREVGEKKDRVAIVVTNTHRAQLPDAEATLIAFDFRPDGSQWVNDEIWHAFFVKNDSWLVPRTNVRPSWSPSKHLAFEISSPGCAPRSFIITPDAKACIMVVLECSSPDAG